MSIGSIFLTVAIFVAQFVGWTTLILIFLLWWFQGLILYMPSFPNRFGERRQLKYNIEGTRLPDDADLPFEEYFIRCDDDTMIHSWLIPQPNRTQVPTIIFFHGNAGNIGSRLFNAKCFYHYTHCNLLLVEYRGYGNSQGSPSEPGFKSDAIAALDFIRNHPDHDPSQIFIFGRSLGGAVASWLVTERPQHIKGVVIENTFTSILDIFFVLFYRIAPSLEVLEKYLRYILPCIMTSHWKTDERMKSCSVPILCMSGDRDELIPPVQMKNLFNIIPDSCYKEFYSIPNGMHNTSYIDGGRLYWKTFDNFIKKISTNKHIQT